MNIDPYMQMIQVITGDYEKRMGKDPVDLAEQEHDRKAWEEEQEHEPDPDEARDRAIGEQIARDRWTVLNILKAMMHKGPSAIDPAVDALAKLIDDARRGMS